MSKPDPKSHNKADEVSSASVRSNIAMLAFGILTLCFLVAIDHEEWFHLRPISVGAVAVSHASAHAAEVR